MTTTTGKLEETLAARAASRARLIDLRKAVADKERQLERLHEELAATSAQVKREKTKLVELTSECGRLLHADLAGVAGKDEPPLLEQPATVVPAVT